MRKILAATLLGLLVSLAFSQPVTITWMVGLGAGAQPEQKAAQDAIVAEFNAAHDDIVLEIVYVTNEVSVTTLSTLIATGEAPDIVGPVGGAGTARDGDHRLDPVESRLCDVEPAAGSDANRQGSGLPLQDVVTRAPAELSADEAAVAHAEPPLLAVLRHPGVGDVARRLFETGVFLIQP